MRHDVKILTNISYSLSQVQRGSNELENSRVCTSSSKLRREVMNETYILWTGKIRLLNNILLYYVYCTNLKPNWLHYSLSILAWHQ